MASSNLRKQIESIKNIEVNLLNEERKINNPPSKEGGDNNQIILIKSFSNPSSSSSSSLSSPQQTLPPSTTVVSSFNNNSSVPVPTDNNNYLINNSVNNNISECSAIVLKNNSSSSGETKSSSLLPLQKINDTSYSVEATSSFKLNSSSSSHTTNSSPLETSSFTQLDTPPLQENSIKSSSTVSSNFSKTFSSTKSPAPDNSSSTPQQPSPSPSSTVNFVPRRRPRHISGIGGGRVRILGVHSEPGSFALEESPLEEEELLIFNKSEEKTEKDLLESHLISSKQKSNNFKGRRQLSAMSSLYRQATIGAAAASVFNSTATTVANALEFVSTVEQQQQQHPNVPPPPQNSRSQSPNNNSSGSISDNNSWSPGGNKAMRKFKKEAPNLQQCTTSSEEGSQIDFSSPSISRTNSAQSIPVPIKSVTDSEELSPYEKTIKMLANDLQCQKELALGKRVGFYRLGKELGAGNFSKVKLGVHVLTKEKVAVKTMEKGKMDQKAQRVLNREIDNMELLHHPNIIRLFEVVATLSKVHLVMEYAGGGELYTYVHDNGKLTEEVAKPIFAQIVSAVAHLHSKNICHRDIKAENVFLSHPGWIKLGDFGFSCKFEDDSFLNTFCGSPPYAAPELFRDQKYIGPMVDIWAMGILLYFMLVGVTPFRGETVSDLKRNILEGVYYMPDYVSTFAQHSITRMLELDAKRRANILELKRTYWLSECKFPDSYVNLSLNPNEHSLAHCKLERLVWSQLQSYGITEEMLRSVAKSKGARNPVIGTYRITLYQCQALDRDKERAKLNEHLLQLAEKNNLLAGKIDERSKACIII